MKINTFVYLVVKYIKQKKLESMKIREISKCRNCSRTIENNLQSNATLCKECNRIVNGYSNESRINRLREVRLKCLS